MNLDLQKLDMYTRYINTVDVLWANYQNVLIQKRNNIVPREFLHLMKSLHVFNEIEYSAVSDHHSKHANETIKRR